MKNILLAVFAFTLSSQAFAVNVVYPEKYSCAALQDAVEDSGAEGLKILRPSFLGYVHSTFYSISHSCGKKKIETVKRISSKDRDDCIVGILCIEEIEYRDPATYMH